MSMMRAAVLHGKEDVRIEDVAIPQAAPGELVVRVHAALTCGTDLKVYRRGYHARMLRPPVAFGHELAGTVHAVGEGVSSFAIGDRVVALNSAPCDVCFYCAQGQQNLCEDLLFNNGAYAQFLRIPARIVEKNTLQLPHAMPFEHAALTEPLACCLRGIEESGARAGQTAVVIGAGPIGLLLMRALSLMGLQVLAVVKHDSQIAVARKFGASDIVHTAATTDAIESARSLTLQHRGADIVFEAAGQPLAWEWAVKMARRGGVVNFFAGPPAGTSVLLDTNLLHYGDITLKASFHHTPATVRRAFALLQDGRFGAEDFLTGRASLGQLQGSFEKLMQRGEEIKIAIDPWMAEGAAS